MNKTQIILASASPRRRELLEQVGISPVIMPADVDETVHEGEKPCDLVRRLSGLKARAVASMHPDALVIASDTVVSLDGKILGKPRSDDDARRMLSSLSGHSHRVYTGVSLNYKGRSLCDYACTEVTFRGISAADIDSYIATGEPRGKAGAYAIQGLGSLFIASIHGDYPTVVGFPLGLFAGMMEELGFSLRDIWEG